MPPETSPQIIKPSSSSGRWIMASAILTSSMAVIDSSALNVILPSPQNDLEAVGTDIFWILNAYLLILAIGWWGYFSWMQFSWLSQVGLPEGPRDFGLLSYRTFLSLDLACHLHSGVTYYHCDGFRRG